MEAIDILAVPGTLVFKVFVGTGESFDNEAMRDLAPMLGVVFWLLIAVAIRVVVSARPSSLAGPASLASIGRRLARVEPGRWLGAAVRAQVVHIGLYALAPLLWEAGRRVLIVAFAPLLMMSFADKTVRATDGSLDHLRQPACWTFVTFCAGPRSDFVHDKVQNLSGCEGTVCPPPESLLEDRGGWGWKSLWLALSLAWILPWWRRAAQRRRLLAPYRQKRRSAER